MHRIAFLTIVLLMALAASHVQAQDTFIMNSDDPPYPCPFTDGAYYQPGVFPRYDANTGNLVLVGADGATVQVLEPITENVRIINWSPDCRYLSGAVGRIAVAHPTTDVSWLGGADYIRWTQRSIVFWDAISGGQRQTISMHPGDYLSQQPVIWDSYRNHALVLGGCYSVRLSCTFERIRYDILWDPETNNLARIEQLPLIDQPYGWIASGESRAYFNQYYWDTAREWLWGSAPGGVEVYDPNSGARIATFQNVSQAESRFTFSQDGTKLMVYTSEGFNTIGALTIYDIATGESTEINVEGFAAPNIPDADYHPVALSWDNRYLVLGYDALRVWDIQNLSANFEDRLPIYRHGGPEALIQSVRFGDWGVIETTSADGVQRWDLHTGIFLP